MTFIGSAKIARDLEAEGRKGNAFPSNPENGQPFQLAVDIEGYVEGFYVYSTFRSDWIKQEDLGPVPYDIGLTVFDRPKSNDVVCKHYAVRTLSLPANFEGSLALASVEASTNYRFTVKLLSVDRQTEEELGYIDFAAFSKTGVFSAKVANVPIVVMRGETLAIVAQEERDATLKSVDITIFGNQLSLSTGLV